MKNSSKYSWRDKVILVAEDNDISFLYYKAILNESQVQILRVKDGKKAVELCQGNNIDLVLMDLSLPVLDGCQATVMIKQLKHKIPVIIQTAYDHPEFKKRGLRAGCDEYISKPIRPQHLLTIINKYFSNSI